MAQSAIFMNTAKVKMAQQSHFGLRKNIKNERTLENSFSSVARPAEMAPQKKPKYQNTEKH